MTAFIQNLIYCSCCMSIITLGFIALNHFFGGKHSSKQRYYSFAVIMIGFLTPVRIRPFGSVMTVVTYEHSGNGVADVGAFNIWQFMFWVWFIGFSVCIIRDIMKHAEFLSVAERFSTDLENDIILNLNDEIKLSKGIKKEVKLRRFPLIASPMIVGLFSPILFLPHDKYDNEQAYLILSHEYVHLKRKDALYKVFIQILKAVHWFNPVVRFVISPIIERECEISCDEEVSKDLSNDMKKLYCDVILESAEHSSLYKTAFSTNFSAGAKSLKKRFKAILSENIKKRILISGIIAAVLTLFSGAMIEFSVIRTDEADYILETTIVTEADENYVQQDNGNFTVAQKNIQLSDHTDVYDFSNRIIPTTTVIALPED